MLTVTGGVTITLVMEKSMGQQNQSMGSKGMNPANGLTTYCLEINKCNSFIVFKALNNMRVSK
jgi:hypothetical protein